MPLFDAFAKKVQGTITSLRPKGLAVPEQELARVLTPGETPIDAIGQALPVYPKTVVLTSDRILLFEQGLASSRFRDFFFRDVRDVKFSTSLTGGTLVITADRGNNPGTVSIANLPLDESRAFYSKLQQVEQEWFAKKRAMALEEARAASGAAQVTPSRVPDAAHGADPNSVEGQLLKLKSLFEQGLLTEADYVSRKNKMLEEI